MGNKVKSIMTVGRLPRFKLHSFQYFERLLEKVDELLGTGIFNGSRCTAGKFEASSCYVAPGLTVFRDTQ